MNNYKVLCECWDKSILHEMPWDLYTKTGFLHDELYNMNRKMGLQPFESSRVADSSLLGGQIGGGVGMVGGGYLGAKLVNKLSGKKERMLIKNIIINSKDIDSAINAIQKIGTKKANKYCSMLNNLRNNSNWKNEMLTSINIKNGLGTAVGAIGGGYLGGTIGVGVGGGIGTGVGLSRYT